MGSGRDDARVWAIDIVDLPFLTWNDRRIAVADR